MALALTAAAVAAGVRLAADRTTALDRFKAAPGGAPSAPGAMVTTSPPGPAPGPGQVFVTGTADRVIAGGAQGTPLAAPFTLTAADRGAGGATIDNALVGGRRTSIAWGGGTPLPISGDGALDVGGITVEVSAEGALWRLQGAAGLTAGRYRIAAPVAVGVGALAEPRDAVEFTADSLTQLRPRGEVVVRRPPGRLQLTGPGSVTITGRLSVRDARSVEPGTRVELGEGPYTLVVSPAPGGIEVDAVLQGPVTRS